MLDSKKIRTLLVTFENDIPAHLLTAFRGAIIEKAGRENVVFHNHIAEEKFVYRYPLIQYKNIQGKAGMVCLEDGVEEIHKFFGQRNWTINLLEQKIELKVDRLDLKTTRLQVWDTDCTYTLYRWQALNEKNYRQYRSLTSIAEKVQMLERILTGNILSFAKGIEWHIDKPIRVSITDIPHERLNKMKDIKVAALDIRFNSNVSLPDWIGLGKGVGRGFGVIKKFKSKIKNGR